MNTLLHRDQSHESPLPSNPANAHPIKPPTSKSSETNHSSDCWTTSSTIIQHHYPRQRILRVKTSKLKRIWMDFFRNVNQSLKIDSSNHSNRDCRFPRQLKSLRKWEMRRPSTNRKVRF